MYLDLIVLEIFEINTKLDLFMALIQLNYIFDLLMTLFLFKKKKRKCQNSKINFREIWNISSNGSEFDITKLTRKEFRTKFLNIVF